MNNTAIRSDRRADIQLDRRVTYMLNGLYRQFGIQYSRPMDKSLDLHGVDVVIDKTKMVDEKAATKYWNRDLRTYSCELTCNRNHNNIGWFSTEANQYYKTSHYMFVWIRAQEKELAHITGGQIMLVDKHALQDAFMRLTGCESTDEVAQMLYDNNLKPIYFSNGIKVMQCNIAPEFPINVIFPKEFLRKYAVLDKSFGAIRF